MFIDDIAELIDDAWAVGAEGRDYEFCGHDCI
jgi:hypothetical protein